jgi:hypothetical protein
VDRRQIEHIELHGGHIRQAGFKILERAVTPWHRRCRARKQLVPRPKPGTLAIDQYAELLLTTGGSAGEEPFGIALHEAGQLCRSRPRDAIRSTGPHRFGVDFMPASLCGRRMLAGGRYHVCADDEVDRAILVGLDAFPGSATRS